MHICHFPLQHGSRAGASLAVYECSRPHYALEQLLTGVCRSHTCLPYGSVRAAGLQPECQAVSEGRCTVRCIVLAGLMQRLATSITSLSLPPVTKETFGLALYFT